MVFRHAGTTEQTIKLKVRLNILFNLFILLKFIMHFVFLNVSKFNFFPFFFKKIKIKFKIQFVSFPCMTFLLDRGG